MPKVRPRVRIESNGLRDLHVYDEDGREILQRAVRRITWKMEPPDFLPVACIEVLGPELIVNGELRELHVTTLEDLKRRMEEEPGSE